MTRPSASLSLDLDNLWSYLKTHGDDTWQALPSYLPRLLDIVLEYLNRHQQKLTFFIVGQDAAHPQNRDPLRRIVEAGHEVGNHSFNHEPWMQYEEESKVFDELMRTHEAIREATGQAPEGFRGPGFCYSESLFNALHRMGYQYDCSILPSVLGPLARLYYLSGTRTSGEEKDKRRNLFGRFSDGFLPLKPFEWSLAGGALLEIPVTTIPILRAPFHLSYVMYLARFSKKLALEYLKTGLRLCRMRGIEPSYLLHPLDFLGKEDAPELAFFPAMDQPRSYKLEIADAFMAELKKRFEVVPLGEHARRIRMQGRLLRMMPPKLRG